MCIFLVTMTWLSSSNVLSNAVAGSFTQSSDDEGFMARMVHVHGILESHVHVYNHVLNGKDQDRDCQHVMCGYSCGA